MQNTPQISSQKGNLKFIQHMLKCMVVRQKVNKKGQIVIQQR